MRRVARIHRMRPFVSAVALRLYALAGILAVLGSLVSVPNVLKNFATAGLSGAGSFAYAAVANTTLIVQALAVAFALVALVAMRDAVRAALTPRYA